MLYRVQPRPASDIGSIEPRRYRAYGRSQLGRIPQLRRLPGSYRVAMEAVAAVFPFRVNEYVLEELIDWSNVPDDPIFQLTFPQPGMLLPRDLERMCALVRSEPPRELIEQAAREIQRRLNPHPGGQMDLNVPRVADEPLPGVQHKYRETVLIFPAEGQTCHAYCSYCFRWAQLVGRHEPKFAGRDTGRWVSYLRNHPRVTSVLITGGDPAIMRTKVLRRYIEPLLDPALEHIASIRIGTKAPAYWPYRFVSDRDADDLLRLFNEVRAAGKHLALMAHYSHPRELETPVAAEAVRRIRASGAAVRTQAPLIRHVNDSADVWAEMWRRQVRLGAIPYYMFVERDTGPRDYFEVPLARALTIFNEAYRQVSGLGRTVRGPCMSATPGKVLIDGTAMIGGRKVFVLKFLQARDPRWVGRPFFAKFDERAVWLDQLEPAWGERFFFEGDSMVDSPALAVR